MQRVGTCVKTYVKDEKTENQKSESLYFKQNLKQNKNEKRDFEIIDSLFVL